MFHEKLLKRLFKTMKDFISSNVTDPFDSQGI